MNVKQGDIAILIKSKNPENLGKILEVCEFFGSTGIYENLWRVKGQTKGSYAPDAWLRPVTGLDDDESTDTITDIDKTKEAV